MGWPDMEETASKWGKNKMSLVSAAGGILFVGMISKYPY